MESDLVVAEEGTKFQVAETKRGLAASRYWALLNLRAGSTFATELVLTGRFFTAEEALAAGIINRVAKKGEHLEAARALAREIAGNPPLSVRATVRSRRWYMELAEKEAYLQTTPLKCGAAMTGFQFTDRMRSSEAFAPHPCGPPFRSNSSRVRN